MTVSLIDQERKKAVSFPFKRILYTVGYWSSFPPPPNLTSSHYCQSHLPKTQLKTWLLSGCRIGSSNSLAVLTFPHTTYLSTFLCFGSGGNDTPFSTILNLSKFYFSIKVQHNGHVLNEASFNSSHHDYSSPFDPYHLAGFN